MEEGGLKKVKISEDLREQTGKTNISTILISLIVAFSIISIIIYFSYKRKSSNVLHYDYLIVGSGLYGATFNYLAKKAGKTTLVLEKRSTKGGNLYCEKKHGIFVHKYGPHIFHTDNKKVWDFVNSLVEFTPYQNQPI